MALPPKESEVVRCYALHGEVSEKNDLDWSYGDKYERAFFEHFQSEYEETRSPLVLYDAIKWAHLCDYRVPAWLVMGLKPILEAACERPGKGYRNPREQREKAMKDLYHYMMVAALKDEGVSAREVFQAASEKLAGTRYKASPDTIQKAYQRLKRFLRRETA